MNGKNASEIIAKYKAGTCTEEEFALVQDWILYGRFEELKFSEAEIEEDLEELDKRLPIVSNPNELSNPYEVNSPRKVRLWPRIGIAAAVAMMTLGVWVYYTSSLSRSTSSSRTEARDLYANDIKPGKNTATLTLPNGKTISLSDTKTGLIIDANKLSYNDGSLLGASFDDALIDPSSRTEWRDLFSGGKDPSTLRDDVEVKTPRGGQYQVLLPDGTKVWLNAASSIKFPSSFQGSRQRVVEITGEVYLEVAKDKAHPFIAKTEQQEVEVLGTHFNVNAYKEEGMTKTTLLEGSVRVSSSREKRSDERSLNYANGKDLSYRGDDVVLRPNQQALTDHGIIKVKEIDVETAIAWKEGKFMFDNESLEAIMKRVSRWYDVEVRYEDESVKQVPFYGTMSRFENISKVLSKLEATGNIKFRVAGNTVYVTK